MRFADSDVRPNVPRPLPPVIGMTKDARWRNVADDVEVMDSTRVHESHHSAEYA